MEIRLLSGVFFDDSNTGPYSYSLRPYTARFYDSTVRISASDIRFGYGAVLIDLGLPLWWASPSQDKTSCRERKRSFCYSHKTRKWMSSYSKCWCYTWHVRLIEIYELTYSVLRYLWNCDLAVMLTILQQIDSAHAKGCVLLGNVIGANQTLGSRLGKMKSSTYPKKTITQNGISTNLWPLFRWWIYWF